jgi:hypothetical protein
MPGRGHRAHSRYLGCTPSPRDRHCRQLHPVTWGKPILASHAVETSPVGDHLSICDGADGLWNQVPITDSHTVPPTRIRLDRSIRREQRIESIRTQFRGTGFQFARRILRHRAVSVRTACAVARHGAYSPPAYTVSDTGVESTNSAYTSSGATDGGAVSSQV